MRNSFFLFILLLLLTNCTNIKNKNALVTEEQGTEVAAAGAVDNMELKPEHSLTGYWVGFFKRPGDEFDSTDIYVDEGFYWDRDNKINLSIDNINGLQVSGHTVVAGIERPFSGTLKKEYNISYFEVKEPGDNKFDGKFTFQVKDSVLTGTWTAYNKIDIPKREYELKKKVFIYDPAVMLNKEVAYVNWEVSKKLNTEDTDMPSNEFATATDKIYQINASARLLSKKDVENLKKGDLVVIRNTIYARHGYSFKNRPLRVFFDEQEWYIPVYSNIKKDFTEIEKQNILLLLRYERNAKEYYDYFGRG